MKPYTAAVRAKGWTMVSFARELGWYGLLVKYAVSNREQWEVV